MIPQISVVNAGRPPNTAACTCCVGGGPATDQVYLIPVSSRCDVGFLPDFVATPVAGAAPAYGDARTRYSGCGVDDTDRRLAVSLCGRPPGADRAGFPVAVNISIPNRESTE